MLYTEKSLELTALFFNFDRYHYYYFSYSFVIIVTSLSVFLKPELIRPKGSPFGRFITGMLRVEGVS